MKAQIAKALGIQQKLCCIYHPEANGLCEKQVGVLKPLLAKLTFDHPENLDSFFYPALFAIREVTHDSTGFSPFELLLGAQPKGVLSVYKDLITNKEVSGTIRDTYTYLLKLRKRIFTS